MHHALLAAGLLPLALASPVANDDQKHKTTTTTITLAPVTASGAEVTPSTFVSDWTSIFTPEPVTFESASVATPEPSTTYSSKVFTMPVSSVIKGEPSTVVVPSVSQPPAHYTSVHWTSAVHNGVPTTIAKSQPSEKPKPKPQDGPALITNTDKKHGPFQLVARPDETHGKSAETIEAKDDTVVIHKVDLKDIWLAKFGHTAGVTPTWKLDHGRLQTLNDAETKDEFYWNMIDFQSSKPKDHDLTGDLGWYLPVLSTNKHKKNFKALKTKFHMRKDWQLVHNTTTDKYDLENKKHAGGFIYCPAYNLTALFKGEKNYKTKEGATLLYGTNTAPLQHCQRIKLQVSTSPASAHEATCLDGTATTTAATFMKRASSLTTLAGPIQVSG